MFIKYWPLIIVVAVVIIAFGYLVFSVYRLEKYRHNVRPGIVVKFKSAKSILLKEVVSRPSRDIVILKNIDDEWNLPFSVSINKIYPL